METTTDLRFKFAIDVQGVSERAGSDPRKRPDDKLKACEGCVPMRTCVCVTRMKENTAQSSEGHTQRCERQADVLWRSHDGPSLALSKWRV